MNIFLHELKAYRKSTIIWTCSMSAVAILFLMMYIGVSKDAEGFKAALLGYPEGLRKALGLSVDIATTMLGFYSFFFGYILLCGAIQAMNLGTSIVSKEVRDKTADFLMTKPVSRKQILTAKLLGIFTSIVITNIIYMIIAIITANMVKTGSFSLKLFIMVSLTMFFVQIMFLSLGIIVSVVFPKIKSVISVSLGTVFSFYIINMFGSVIGEKAVRYITPFKYYDPMYIIKNGSYEIVFVIVEIVFVVLAIFASYQIYSKKDIHAV